MNTPEEALGELRKTAARDGLEQCNKAIDILEAHIRALEDGLKPVWLSEAVDTQTLVLKKRLPMYGAFSSREIALRYTLNVMATHVLRGLEDRGVQLNSGLILEMRAIKVDPKPPKPVVLESEP